MGYPEPLRQLHERGVVELQARFFCRNCGVTLLIRKGNPLGIRGLSDVLRTGTRIALPDAGDVRAKCRAAADALLQKPAADALFAAEVRSFPGRLGIMHPDLPEMVARSYADAAFTWHHLVSYLDADIPEPPRDGRRCGGEPFFTEIALARAVDPLRARALQAFDEFFFGRAREVYPRYHFASMDNDEFGRTLVMIDLRLPEGEHRLPRVIFGCSDGRHSGGRVVPNAKLSDREGVEPRRFVRSPTNGCIGWKPGVRDLQSELRTSPSSTIIRALSSPYIHRHSSVRNRIGDKRHPPG